MAKISIIIPAFNPGTYLKIALESILKQTYTDWMTFVVDDGSTEDLCWAADIDPRIKLIRQANQGLSIARNTGICHSRSEFTAFLDADDVWEPEKLSVQLAAMENNPSRPLCHTLMTIIDGAGKVQGKGWGGNATTYDEILIGCDICVSTVLVRTATLFDFGLFNPLFRTAQDHDLWLKILHRYQCIAISTSLVRYRVHPHNMSKNYLRSFSEQKIILTAHEQIATYERASKSQRSARKGLRNMHYNYVVIAINATLGSFMLRDWLGSLRHLGNALSINAMQTLRVISLRASKFIYSRIRLTRISHPKA